MKKLIIISMFAISFIATAQYSTNDDFNSNDSLLMAVLTDVNLDELIKVEAAIEDAPFDFNTKDYLPLGFNPYAKENEILFEQIIEEEDAPFDFDTSLYLPAGFDPLKGLVAEPKKTI